MKPNPFAPILALLPPGEVRPPRLRLAVESPEDRAESWAASRRRSAAERAAAGPVAVAVAKVCPLLGSPCQGDLCAAWVGVGGGEGYCAHFAALRAQVRGGAL